MSNVDESGPAPEQSAGESLDLGPAPWVPTQPASRYVGPLPGQPADSQSSTLPGQSYGQSDQLGQGYGQPGQPGSYGQPSQPGQGYGQPGQQSYGQPVQDYGQPVQEYQNYGPQGGQTYPPYQPYPSVPPSVQAQMFPPAQPYSVQQYPAVHPGAPLVPGQVAQTPYGSFMVGQKSKLAAGLLGIFLGGFGVGRFYRGNTGLGVAQLVVTLVTAGAGWIWGFVEGIVVLVSQPGSPSSLDSNGQIMI